MLPLPDDVVGADCNNEFDGGPHNDGTTPRGKDALGRSWTVCSLLAAIPHRQSELRPLLGPVLNPSPHNCT